MHFRTLLVTTVGATLITLSGAQAKKPCNPENVGCGTTVFSVEDLHASSNIYDGFPEYHFYVTGTHKNSADRSFERTECTVGANFGKAKPSTLSALVKGNCTDPSVTWRFRRYGKQKQKLYLKVSHHVPIEGDPEQELQDQAYEYMTIADLVTHTDGDYTYETLSAKYRNFEMNGRGLICTTGSYTCH